MLGGPSLRKTVCEDYEWEAAADQSVLETILGFLCQSMGSSRVPKHAGQEHSCNVKGSRKNGRAFDRSSLSAVAALLAARKYIMLGISLELVFLNDP